MEACDEKYLATNVRNLQNIEKFAINDKYKS